MCLNPSMICCLCSDLTRLLLDEGVDVDACAGAARVKHDAVEDLAGVSRATEGRQGVPKPLGEIHSIPLRRRRCEERPDGQKIPNPEHHRHP